jgi:hypothetical protein
MTEPESAEPAPESVPEEPPPPEPARRAARLRLLTISGILLLHGLTLLAWAGTWITGSVQGTPVAVGGDVAAPAVPALALAGLALAAALTIAGPVFRAILGVLQVLLGASIALSGLLVLADPRAAAAPAITARTGIAGDRSVGELLDGAAITALPALTVALGVASAALGLLLLGTLRRWPSRSRRFSAVRFEQDDEADPAPPGASARVGDWDALSEGEDPTAEGPDSAGGEHEDRGTAG